MNSSTDDPSRVVCGWLDYHNQYLETLSKMAQNQSTICLTLGREFWNYPTHFSLGFILSSIMLYLPNWYCYHFHYSGIFPDNPPHICQVLRRPCPVSRGVNFQFNVYEIVIIYN